jgi:hypothetical protein
MIHHSALYQEAIHFSHSTYTRVDMVRNDVVVQKDVPVTSGKFVSDRSSDTRLECDVNIALYPWETANVDVYSSRFRLYRGITSIGYNEVFMVGEYRVEQISRTIDGTLNLKGTGLEAYITDARFLRPRMPMYGANTVAAIQQLITEVVPHARFRNEATRNRSITATSPWERERMDAIDALAESIGAELFCGSDGVFVLRNVPDLINGTPVCRVFTGPTGMIKNESVKNNRDKVYNAVSVQGAEGIWAWAYDSDPNSPTYYFGEYGQVPRFYSSQYIYDVAQAQRTADKMLSEILGENRTLSFESSPFPFLESGDIVKIGLSDGSVENHLLEKISLDLGVDGSFTADTISTRSKVA